MECQWIRVLLGGLLPDETVQMVCGDYDKYKDVLLSQLGLDSMAVMGLVLKIETEFGREIDYEDFDLADVSTLSRAKEFLKVD